MVERKRDRANSEIFLTSLSRSTLRRLAASMPPSLGGRVSNGLNDNQTTIQELEVENHNPSHPVQNPAWTVEGIITLGDIMEILPFEDTLVILEVDKKTVWAPLEAGLGLWPAREG